MIHCAACPWLRSVVITILLFCCCHQATAQVSLFYNEKTIRLPAETLQYYTDSSRDQSFERYEIIKPRLKSYGGKNTLRFIDKQVWIRFNLDAVPKSGLTYFMIRNPHINYLRVWFVKNDSIVQEFPLTGDRIAFSSRVIHHPDFVFPLLDTSLRDYSILICADKRNELLNIPLYFLDDDGFLTYNRKKNLVAGLILGLSFFLFFFNLFLFVQMRERLYVFYGLYILMGLFYILSDYGYSFMYLFPNNPLPADYMRPISLCLATPLYLLFCLELLQLKKALPNQHRWMSRGLVCYAVLFITSIPFMGYAGLVRVIAQNLMQFLLTSLVLANFFVAIVAWRKKIRYALYIVVTSLFLFITITLYGFFLSGDIADTAITRNLMNIGFIGEITILAFALSLRFKHYKEQSEELLRKSNLQQEQIFKTVADYQEKELQRLSSLLHDSVGARLSALRFNLEAGQSERTQNGKLEQVISDVNELANDVRQFSHSFSPLLLQKKGLRDSVQQFISHVNESGRLSIQFEMIGSLERVSFRYELLIYNIIQELIQNIIKHSNASEAIVQILLEDQLASIFVEDNGRGFNTTTVREGLGFSQIKQLVTFVNGNLQIDSSENKGTRVSIEFSALPDEKKHPDTYS